LDDTLTQGGTLAQLKTHIEDNGGRVVLAAALTGKNYSRKLSLDSSTLAEVRGKYGSIEPWFRETFGYGFEGLTQSEARTILTFDRG
ncbi:phosphoribosyltransferase, partial [Pseudomonas sp. BAgro211]|nr:phosphoribosyltransferase [Pseudomonas sp. BAgro211]